MLRLFKGPFTLHSIRYELCVTYSLGIHFGINAGSGCR